MPVKSSIQFRSIASGEPTRTFLDGSEYWVVELPSLTFGVGFFKPGWVWSKHAGPQTGAASQAHIGYIQSGAMVVEDADGRSAELGAGDVFEVGPGHDARVVGEDVCVALDFSVKRSS